MIPLEPWFHRLSVSQKALILLQKQTEGKEGLRGGRDPNSVFAFPLETIDKIWFDGDDHIDMGQHQQLVFSVSLEGLRAGLGDNSNTRRAVFS